MIIGKKPLLVLLLLILNTLPNQTSFAANPSPSQSINSDLIKARNLLSAPNQLLTYTQSSSKYTLRTYTNNTASLILESSDKLPQYNFLTSANLYTETPSFIKHLNLDPTFTHPGFITTPAPNMPTLPITPLEEMLNIFNANIKKVKLTHYKPTLHRYTYEQTITSSSLMTKTKNVYTLNMHFNSTGGINGLSISKKVYVGSLYTQIDIVTNTLNYNLKPEDFSDEVKLKEKIDLKADLLGYKIVFRSTQPITLSIPTLNAEYKINNNKFELISRDKVYSKYKTKSSYLSPFKEATINGNLTVRKHNELFKPDLLFPTFEVDKPTLDLVNSRILEYENLEKVAKAIVRSANSISKDNPSEQLLLSLASAYKLGISLQLVNNEIKFTLPSGVNYTLTYLVP